MKRTLYIFWGLIILLIIGYAIIITNAPVKRLRLLQHEVRESKLVDVENERVLQLDELSELMKEKSSKEASLKMANLDSIGLMINLQDSVISLMLKGIKLHPSKIESYQYDRFFKAIDQSTAFAIFSSPLKIENQESNVEKRPYMHKIAPKDTSEVSSEIMFNDTTKNVAISLKLTTEYGFQILLLAKDDDYLKKQHNRKELNKAKINAFIRNINAIIKRKPINYTPEVTIYLKSEDIINIYRAIPFNAHVIVAFPE